MGQDYGTRSGGEQIQSGELSIDIERPYDSKRIIRANPRPRRDLAGASGSRRTLGVRDGRFPSS